MDIKQLYICPNSSSCDRFDCEISWGNKEYTHAEPHPFRKACYIGNKCPKCIVYKEPQDFNI